MLRFAQSPTHDMNIGDLRIAILNYLVSQQRNEGFTIRIDDTDKEAMVEGKDTEIMQILEKFALVHDSVFHQSEHLHMHQTLAIKLLEEDKAFVCTCDENQEECLAHCDKKAPSEYSKLKESGEPFVLRIKKPTECIVYHDLIKGEVSATPDEVDAFVILRQDASPTHDFASACDDMLSGVTYLIQEDKNLASTARQKHIKTALGYEEETTYAHLPTLLNDDDTFSIKWLFEEGFLPDAIINYLLLPSIPILNNADAPQEIFTLPEAIAWFKVENIPNTAVTFDIEKLRFINREHLKNMDDKALSTLFGFADADIGKLAKLYLEDATTVKELRLAIESIFSPKNFEGKWANQMRTMETLIQDAPMFHDYATFEAYLLKKTGLTGQDFFKALRLLLTGTEHGPELSAIYPYIKPYILEIAS